MANRVISQLHIIYSIPFHLYWVESCIVVTSGVLQNKVLSVSIALQGQNQHQVIFLIIAITLLFFLSLLYSYPVFGTPTAPRAFQLLTRFKWSQFGTDLRQCSCFSDSVSIFLSFCITLFISFNLPLTWMGRCWLAKTNHMTIQADVVIQTYNDSYIQKYNKTYLPL